VVLRTVGVFGHHLFVPIDPSVSDAGQPRRTSCQVLLDENAGVRDLTVDDARFVVPAGKYGREATFRLQLFIGPDLRPIAVITQVVNVEGAGVINHGERYAEAIWAKLLPDEPRPPLLIGRMIFGAHEADGLRESGWHVVDFQVADGGKHEIVRKPIWGPKVNPEDLEYLVGGPVDGGRGEFVIPAPEPGPVERFAIRPVLLLPRSDLDEPECMPRPTPLWRRLGRQIVPRRGGRSCCWYHQGDWHAVTATAIDVLRLARADGDVEDLHLRAVELARDLALSGWQWQALESLFLDPIQVAEPESRAIGVGYVNGRHRAQAMLDQGVHRTVVVVYDWPGRRLGNR